jgi:hypothetical protein
MQMQAAAQGALDIFANGGEATEKMAYKLAEYAWLEGWIAALTYLQSKPGTAAPENPYARD